MKARSTPAAAILVLGVLCSPLAAEQIIMRNGQVYNGRIVNQTRTEVILDTPAGRIVLRKAEIRRITYGATAEEKAREDAQKKEEERKLQEQKRREEEKAKELQKQEEKRLADEAARKREEERQAELKKQQAAREEAAKAEARKLEEARKQEASRNAEELRRQEEQKRMQELKRTDEHKGLTEEQIRLQIREEVRREFEAAEARRRAEEQRLRESQSEKQITRGAAFMRSAVLPGWGQIYQGRKIGYFYGAAALGLAGISSTQDKIYRARQSNYRDSARNFLLLTPFVTRLAGYAQDDFQATTTLFLGIDHNERALYTYQKAAQRAQFARGAFLGLYAWSLIDVLVFHKGQNTSAGVSAGPDSLQVSFQYRF